MKRVIVVVTLMLLAVQAVGMPSSAWGTVRQSARQICASHGCPRSSDLGSLPGGQVAVDMVHNGKAHDLNVWTFGISHFRIMVSTGPVTGFGITVINIETTPIQVQTPTPEKSLRQGPDLDQDPWEDIK